MDNDDQVIILVKTDGDNRQTVHGITSDKKIADVWVLGLNNFVIFAVKDKGITNDPLPAIKY